MRCRRRQIIVDIAARRAATPASRLYDRDYASGRIEKQLGYGPAVVDEDGRQIFTYTAWVMANHRHIDWAFFRRNLDLEDDVFHACLPRSLRALALARGRWAMPIDVKNADDAGVAITITKERSLRGYLRRFSESARRPAHDARRA